MADKIKIVLDADVIIHFSKGEILSLLPKIFPECRYVVLDKVKEELRGDILKQLENQIFFFKNIELLSFGETGEERREFAKLISRFGKGESACMVYCRYHNDVIGSSNLKDITKYCDTYNITYLTTIDFLWYAIQKCLLSEKEAVQFTKDVKAKGSKLPDVDFSTYYCNKM